MTRGEFRRRLRALGYATRGAAARALGVSPSSVSRWWSGRVALEDRHVRLLELLEAAQPARITPRQARVLLTAPEAVAGAPVTAPAARSRFEARVSWTRTIRELEAAGIIQDDRLTELGARCVAFLR